MGRGFVVAAEHRHAHERHWRRRRLRPDAGHGWQRRARPVGRLGLRSHGEVVLRREHPGRRGGRDFPGERAACWWPPLLRCLISRVWPSSRRTTGLLSMTLVRLEANINKPAIFTSKVHAHLGRRHGRSCDDGRRRTRMTWEFESLLEVERGLATLDAPGACGSSRRSGRYGRSPTPTTAMRWAATAVASLSATRWDMVSPALLKTKPRDGGIHAVYKLGESDNAMKEIVVSMRPDDKTHRQARRAGGGGTVYSPVLRTGAQTTRYI